MKKTYQFECEEIRSCDDCPIDAPYITGNPACICALNSAVQCSSERRPADCPLKEVDSK